MIPNLKSFTDQLIINSIKIILKKDKNKSAEVQKLNITDPSIKLESEIKIRGHENEKNVNGPQKLNITDPSVDDLEKKLRIPGHENEKNRNPQLNITDPSIDKLVNEVKIPGHENETNLMANQKLNITGPSVDEIEKELRIKGHENEKPIGNKSNYNFLSYEKYQQYLILLNTVIKIGKIFKMAPSVDEIDGELIHGNPKFKHHGLKKKIGDTKQNLTKIEPSIEFLEKQVKVVNGSLNEQIKINRSDILPNHEGFVGVLARGDETFVVGELNVTRRPADIEDFKTWMQSQEKESKLNRFKRLQNEFENLNKRMDDHDFKPKLKTVEGDKSEKGLKKDPNERLAQVIKELEEEEIRLKKNSIKTDL